MHYSIVWSESAEDELTDIWINAENQRSITNTCNEIENKLSKDPLQISVTLSEGLYAYQVDSLRIIFELQSEKHLVLILKVRQI